MVRLKKNGEMSRSTRYRLNKILQDTTSDSENDEIRERVEREDAEIIQETENITLSHAHTHNNDYFGDVEDNDSIIDDSSDDENVINSDLDSSLNSNHNTTDEDGENDFFSINSSSDLSDSSESEDSSDTSENEENTPFSTTKHLNDPIYPGAPLTLGESVLSILTFAIRHKVTKRLLADLLSLINLHCIKPNFCIRTLYFFSKFFKNLQVPLQRHFFCSICFLKLKTQKTICGRCKKKTEVSYFIQLPLIPQIMNLFKRPGFFNSLQGRFNRQKQNPDNLEDIYDGEVYKSLFDDNGILSHPSNISFTWNTDGIALFKSSKFNIWPFYLTINELPFKERAKKQNVLLAGLWFGSKPEPNLFMDSFRQDLRKIFKGFWCKTHDLNRLIKVRGLIICGTCDLPAKSSFMNMKGHNAMFGCCHCEIKSQYFNRRRVYPYKNNFKLRTTEESIRHGKKAFETKKPVKGIKGPTVLSQLVHDTWETTVVDGMHCVYQGVTKRVFRLLFDKEFKSYTFSLSEHIEWINQKLKEISPPSIVSRLTRSVYDYKYWKASEWKQWLLYYSVPLLSTIMEKKYLEHHKLLVLAITYLSSSSVSRSMIQVAAKSLRKYVAQFEKLYGKTHMTCNLHSLIHLAEAVEKFGPLPITSCFAFEDLNGSFSRSTNGTRYTQLQICSGLLNFSGATELKLRLNRTNEFVTSFCSNLELSTLRRRKLTSIYEKIFIVGKLNKIEFTDYFKNTILRSGFVIQNPVNTYSFNRLFKDSMTYDSIEYRRIRRTNSSVIIYNDRYRFGIGIIENFIKICYCDVDIGECSNDCDGHVFAMVSKCYLIQSLIINPDLNLIHLCVKSNSPPIAIDIRSLSTVCFCVKNDDRNYPNSFYVIKPVSLLDCD